MIRDERGEDPFCDIRAPIRDEEILCGRNLRVVSEISSLLSFFWTTNPPMTGRQKLLICLGIQGW